MRDQNQDYQRQLAALHSKQAAADNQVTTQVRNNESLKDELASQGREDAIIRTEAPADDDALKGEMLDLKDENSTLQIHIASLDSRLSELQSKIDEQNRQIDEAK